MHRTLFASHRSQEEAPLLVWRNKIYPQGRVIPLWGMYRGSCLSYFCDVTSPLRETETSHPTQKLKKEGNKGYGGYIGGENKKSFFGKICPQKDISPHIKIIQSRQTSLGRTWSQRWGEVGVLGRSFFSPLFSIVEGGAKLTNLGRSPESRPGWGVFGGCSGAKLAIPGAKFF